MPIYADVEEAAKTVAYIEELTEQRAREDAADAAAHMLMHTRIVDMNGKETSLEEMAEACDMDETVHHAARDVFLALADAQMTYRAFSQLSGLSLMRAPRSVRAAVHHFYAIIGSAPDLQRIGLGRGELLLGVLDWPIDDYLLA